VAELDVLQKMKIPTMTILCAIIPLFAHAEGDFISSWTSSKDSSTEYVLRVPKKDQQSSFWDPNLGPIPIAPEKAIKLVFESDSISRDKSIWKLLQVQLSANSPLLGSTSSTVLLPSKNALVTHYSISVSHQQTGVTMGFLVLMDGRVFQPRLENKTKAEQAVDGNPH